LTARYDGAACVPSFMPSADWPTMDQAQALTVATLVRFKHKDYTRLRRSISYRGAIDCFFKSWGDARTVHPQAGRGYFTSMGYSRGN